jgi:ferritin-like metal-binding protein YciE
MPLANLHDVFVDQIRDLYNAEGQLTKALPKVAKAATTPELRKAFEDHLRVTEGHVQRLEEVFQELDLEPKGKTCKGMKGLIDEGKEVLEKKRGNAPAAVDAALIAGAQRIEHYEIAAYGTARACAEQLGLDAAARLLQQTLDEESEANELLTEIAEKRVNPAATEETEEQPVRR